MSMEKVQQDKLKLTLETELKHLHERVQQHKDDTLASTELSHYDNHAGDEGSDLYNEELQQALNEKDVQYLAEIKAALGRIENGSYGKCDVCGKSIDYARLEAIPTTTTCIDHADSDKADQPYQPYQTREGLAVDDVDALAQLEEYGSSDSKAEQVKQTMKDPFENVSKDSKHV